MDERDLEELRRRVHRAEQDGTYGEQYLLDKLELVLEEADMDTSDGLAMRMAEGLAEEPDEWEKWVVYSEDDYLSWQIVQSLVEVLWKREPEALRRGPLFSWIVGVARGTVEPIPRRPRGRDARLHQFRNTIIAVTLDRLCNLPDGPEIFSGKQGKSACHLVAKRVKSMGRKRYLESETEQDLKPGTVQNLEPETVHKIWQSYESRIKDAGLLGTHPSWARKEIAD